MTTSRFCKQFMAFVMSVALVLSVLFVPGGEASAADPVKPEVKVIGATIRLDSSKGDNEGTQSMRIGIQVDNANRAYACGITLTVGSKSHTVATKASKGDTVQEKLHSKDVPGNSVIYAVVLKNIPESAFYSDIAILGKAWDKDDNLYISDEAHKNVVGVVNTIQDKFPGLNICILNGSLYKNAGASKLTAGDLAGYSNDPDPEMTSNPLATPAPTRVPVGPDEWEVPFERFEETGEGEIFYSGGNDHDICAHVYDSYSGDLLCTNETGTQYVDGLVVNLPASEVAKNYRHVTVKYEYLSDSGRFGYKYRDTEGTEYFTFADFSRDGNTTEINIDTACVPVSKFFIITYDTGVSIRLKSIVFSNPAGLPTPTPTAAPTATPASTAVPDANFFAVQVPDGNSITVDGAVDAVWANAIEYPFLYYSNGRVRNSSEATIRLLWDEDYIYGLYDVYDVRIDESNDDEWNRDGIEIFFDEDNSKESAYGGSSDANTDAFQYRVSGLATDVTAPVKNGFSHNTSATATLYDGLTSRVKTAGNGCGYRVEFAIPVAQKNNLNRVVGFDSTVMDAQGGTRNNEMWFTSQKTGSMYGDASLFENVKLIADKPATPVNSPVPGEPADCLAHFTFDNDTRDGYVYKSTDGNAKATVIGSISGSSEAISGQSLYKEKGNPSYVRIQNADGSSMLDGKDNVTISYWSYIPEAYDNNAINYGWAFYAGRHGIKLGTSNRYYLALIDRDSKYRLDMAKSGGGGNNVDNIAKNSGVWNNVTVVVNGTTSTVYVNGVQQATLSGITLSEALGTDSDFFIGIRPWEMGDGAEYFQGYIDDFAVFGRAFTASEVSSYVGVVAVPTPNPTPVPTATPTPTATPRPVTDTTLDPANLVANGNFANGTTGWSTNYSNGISNQTVDYSHVLQVASRWNSFSGPKTTISGNFSVGDVLTYQYKVKRSRTLDNYSRYFVLKFVENEDEHESRPSSSSDGSATAVGDANHWVTYYGTYTVQEATSSLNIILMESGYVAYDDDHPSANYTFYLDDVQIVKTYSAPTPTPPASPTPGLDVPYTNTAITIDGTADAVWSIADAHPLNYYSGTKGDTNAAAKLLWDNENMYVLIDVTDPSIDKSSGSAWERDGAEIFFDEDLSRETSYDNNTDAFQYRFTGFEQGAAATTSQFASSGSAAATRYAGRQIAYTLTSYGYIIECAIPFYSAPSIGKTVGFEMSVMDCSGGARNNEIWLLGPNKNNMYQNPGLFGIVRLADAPAINPVSSAVHPAVTDIDSCIAYYTFDEPVNGAFASETGDSKAAINGSRLSNTSESVSGNSVFMPSNNNSYLTVAKNDGTSLLSGYDQLTISYWSRVPEKSSSVGWIFFAKDKSQSAGDRFTISLREQFDSIRLARAKVADGSSSASSDYLFASHPNSVEGEWKNVTAVIDGSESKLYVNGELAGTSSVSPNLSTYINSNSELFIGYAPWGSGEYYYGYIDELAVMSKAYSAEEVRDYYDSFSYEAPLPTPTPDVRILSCSDYQIWYWDSSDNKVHDDRDKLIPQVREIFTATKNAGFDNPDFFLFGGDFTSTHDVSAQDEGMAQLKELTYSTWTNLNDDNSLYIQGNHDESLPGTHGLAASGAHMYDQFIIYALNEDTYPSTQDSSGALTIVQNTANTLSSFLAECVSRGENRPIFIASHTGLHYDADRRDGNNQYAYLMYNAIQEYADDLDIVFVFGHNHSNGDETVGGSITFYTPGDSIEICHENSISNKSGTPSTIGFVYMNYGYIGNVGDITNNPSNAPWVTNILVTNAINIFPDRITVDRFSTNGQERAYHTEVARLHNNGSGNDPISTPTPGPTAEPTATPQPVVKTFSKVSAIEENARYAIAMGSITPTGMASGYYYLDDANTGETTTVMSYAAFSPDSSDPDQTTLWKFEAMSDGYAIRSASISDDSAAYLNITSAGVTMGAKQQLTVTESSGSFTIKNDTYLLRFTNSGGSGSTPGYTSGTKTASSTFGIYKVIISRNAYQSVYIEDTNEMPTYTMAFVSDIHIDYGLQSSAQLRQGFINTASRIREEEDANMIGVLGDVTSNNAGQGWTRGQYDNVMTNISGVLGGATEDGHVLMVSGNHDFVAGGSGWNSGDYSGIMEAANYALDPSEYLDQDDDSDSSVANLTKNNPNVSMRLAYHYVIDGMDFIGINTPYSGGDNHGTYVLTESTMDWVENKLAEIGHDKPIVVMTHYPLSDSRNVKKFMADPYNTELKNMLLPYENAILLYGHDHGNVFISGDTYERVTPYASDGTVLNNRPENNDSFVSSFVGSMGYYSNEYNSGLSAAEPDVVQALIIYMYSDRVTFQMKNYGIHSGTSAYPEAYTIYKDTGLAPNYR